MGHNISRCLFDNIDSDGDGQQKTLLRACCFNFSKGKEHSDDFIKHPKDTTTQSKKCEIDDDLSRKLFTAVYYGKKKTLVTILRLLVDVDVSSVTWSKGLNSLHVASMRGHLSCVTLLCSVCKFDVDALDEVSFNKYCETQCATLTCYIILLLYVPIAGQNSPYLGSKKQKYCCV